MTWSDPKFIISVIIGLIGIASNFYFNLKKGDEEEDREENNGKNSQKIN